MKMKDFMTRKRGIAAAAVFVLMLAGGTALWAQGDHDGDDGRYGRNGYEWIDAVYVGEIKAGSPADEAGFLPGDKILTVAGESVSNDEAVETLIRRRTEGSALAVTVQRGEKELSFEVTPVKKGLNKNYVGWDLDGLHNER